MFIAEEKLKTNIAEYIIYMYQIEDVLRAFQFDLDKIRAHIILPQVKVEALEKQAEDWYAEIIREMKTRKLETKGHLNRVNEIVSEIIYLHNTLKEVVQDEKYLHLLSAAQQHIEAFQEKSDLKNAPLVQVCFQALYMKMLLKIQKKEIGSESEAAFDSMRIILAYLTRAYHQMKSGDMSMFEKK